ncbi:MAG TPA: protein kinase, partial [Myxococcota bacterium]|nr:protein kinase [Myxococcota bacterium]
MCSAALAAPRRPGKGAPTSRRAARGKLPVEPGTIVGGRYRVVDGVANGAAGWVVRARDEEVDLDVALKLVAPNLLQADDERARFLKLVRTAKKLHHPNVVRIYDEGEQGATLYYTMPFLEGLTLRKIIDLRVERGQMFGFAEVLPIAAQLASAIDGWQKIGVHGALRPHNIVVLPDVLKVTGFAHQRGIPSRPLLALHQQQRTIDYIAPEVRQEERDLTAAADTYALSIMLGEMLVGRLQSPDPAAWLDAASKLPTAVVEVLRKGASELAADRYESGVALFQEL